MQNRSRQDDHVQRLQFLSLAVERPLSRQPLRDLKHPNHPDHRHDGITLQEGMVEPEQSQKPQNLKQALD